MIGIKKLTVLLLTMLMFISVFTGCEPSEVPLPTEPETQAETEQNTDVALPTDTEPETIVSETDESDTVTEATFETDTDTETATDEVYFDTETIPVTDTETETETVTEAVTETETETTTDEIYFDTETVTDTQTETVTEAATETDTETVTENATETETETEIVTEKVTETETETESETEAEAETECTEHNFVWELVGEPACEDERSYKGTCACGEETTKTEPPVGHNEIITRGSLPTEAVPGYTDSVYCDVCKATLRTTDIVPTVSKIESDILADVTYEGDSTGNLKFHWKVNEAYKNIFLGMWVSVKLGSDTTTYEIMDSDGIWEFKATGGLSRFEFTFSPITAEGEQGNDKLIYFYWFPDVYEMEFPRVEIHTLEGELPTYTRVDCPPGCWGAGITDAEYVQSIVSVYSASNTLLYTSESSGFDGAKMKVRGNTSALASKKPFKIKLSKKFDLLSSFVDRDPDIDYRSKDWLLMKSGESSNIAVGSTISELVGNPWTPQYTYVTLFVNGEYRGLYILMESVEDGEARCDVSDDGYIVEMDAYWWKEPLYITTPISENRPAKITFKLPDPEDVPADDESILYIKQYLTDLENVMLGNKEGDINDYLDMHSFAKWMLTHDILASYDSGGSNMYMTKYDNTSESKMLMGPVWDYDSIYWSAAKFKIDTFARIRYEGHFYMSYLAKHPDFTRAYKEEYDAVRNEVISEVAKTLEFFKSDTYAILLQREKSRWGTGVVDQSAAATTILSWLDEHLSWMDENVPVPPASDPEPELPENEDENKGEWDVQ